MNPVIAWIAGIVLTWMAMAAFTLRVNHMCAKANAEYDRRFAAYMLKGGPIAENAA